ncbi:stage II sporulation protein P [Caldicoprobacter guelmensis]|uniref:stage II sporulation protein P n=1 Tax=Caldicoprobacter guelmensis TaxID=1170224 RepID=UPI00195AF84A|nr:stage II sporulation protein P [Caldicoprobacter guelmensis]MBM7581763.1 stage II sporulation protein P [Caldicoprobacter guelmensis]
MSKKVSRAIVFCFLIAIAVSHYVSTDVYADDWFEKERGYYTLLDDTGKELTLMAREVLVKDEYISSDNKRYSVISVDKEKKRAVLKYMGDVKLPEVEEISDSVGALAQQFDKKGNILLYCTHSDESYAPSDGTHSRPGGGGIFDVAEAFRDALRERGINAVLDKTPHDPHDAGAYRRSRQTAISLIRQYSPVAAIFDIHRDAVPGHIYVTRVAGQPMTKVRIVVGSRNQNRKANEELAYKIKAIADKVYPGLIKDIYIGAGAYNQELSPRSLIFEFGTHENSKESAARSAQYMADVVDKAMFGGTIQGKTQEGQDKGTYRTRPINEEVQRGGRRGIVWLVLVLVIGVVVFIAISGGTREMFSKITGNTDRDERDRE